MQLICDGKVIAQRRITREQPIATFEDLSPGEYSLECRRYDSGGQLQSQNTYTNIGIGTVIAALGDSITEGYFSHGFMRDDLHLTADHFPAESVSKDGRNFPQFAPTTKRHLPTVNCFESWMTRLNDHLAQAWRQPVFIANEGWGGITTASYLTMMQGDASWQKRMRRLRPRIWLIHLGVNDERAGVPAEDVRSNLAAIIAVLQKDYNAQPSDIFLCRPAYDYAAGAEPVLRSYAVEIDRLIEEHGLSRGPDFFSAFAGDRQRWYGADPVHPNLQGTIRMADMWNEAIRRQLPSAP